MSAHALRKSLDLEPTGDGQTKTVSPRWWAPCIRCGKGTTDPVLVGFEEVPSGPGRNHYADDKCARILARSPFAPYWLKARYTEGAA